MKTMKVFAIFVTVLFLTGCPLFGGSDGDKPSANFSWAANLLLNSNTICKGAKVTVKDLSDDNGSPITSWQWYFSNGSPSAHNGQNPPGIYYNSLGSGGIRLIVANENGESSYEVSFGISNCK